jgi:transposase-like protein
LEELEHIGSKCRGLVSRMQEECKEVREENKELREECDRLEQAYLEIMQEF